LDLEYAHPPLQPEDNEDRNEAPSDRTLLSIALFTEMERRCHSLQDEAEKEEIFTAILKLWSLLFFFTNTLLTTNVDSNKMPPDGVVRLRLSEPSEISHQ